jgi:magnesium chelatase subunit H
LVQRYAQGLHEPLRALAQPEEPIEYPEVGLYHPQMKNRISENLSDLPDHGRKDQPAVGLLLLRSYLLAGNALHYDAVITALQARGLRVVAAFASGLDSRPAIEKFFMDKGVGQIDALVSLTGFSLVGGPAYNDAQAAEAILTKLDVPYIAAHPVEFQSLDQWGDSQRGLLPVESTIMVAIPELDGSTIPMVYGGRPGAEGVTCHGCERQCTFTKDHQTQDMFTCAERTDMLARRVEKLVQMRRKERSQRKLALVIFNFPPNSGNVGTAAYLSVFDSVFNTLTSLANEGYNVQVPSSVDALRDQMLNGLAFGHGLGQILEIDICVSTFSQYLDTHPVIGKATFECTIKSANSCMGKSLSHNFLFLCVNYVEPFDILLLYYQIISLSTQSSYGCSIILTSSNQPKT